MTTVTREGGRAPGFVGTPMPAGRDVAADGRFLVVMKHEARVDQSASQIEVVDTPGSRS
jgi:hypothetical protein